MKYQGSYVVRGSKLAKSQQAHVVIEIIINAHLTEGYIRQNLLVKITDYSIRQNFAPSNIRAIRYTHLL